ncbi:hypothetical protein BDA99DRAFT_533672 [Phascolomyces articulosus]|uniref:Uncharacterized protein n=1 Tax=Phascolomyces articulosus TaxID=60185 RepID=A0AAD5PHT6_9FUNG|nr:hypothetical protein BDA99DRAFT_533672 [Phascolomyces articulosus]
MIFDDDVTVNSDGQFDSVNNLQVQDMVYWKDFQKTVPLFLSRLKKESVLSSSYKRLKNKFESSRSVLKNNGKNGCRKARYKTLLEVGDQARAALTDRARRGRKKPLF